MVCQKSKEVASKGQNSDAKKYRHFLPRSTGLNKPFNIVLAKKADEAVCLKQAKPENQSEVNIRATYKHETKLHSQQSHKLRNGFSWSKQNRFYCQKVASYFILHILLRAVPFFLDQKHMNTSVHYQVKVRLAYYNPKSLKDIYGYMQVGRQIDRKKDMYAFMQERKSTCSKMCVCLFVLFVWFFFVFSFFFQEAKRLKSKTGLPKVNSSGREGRLLQKPRGKTKELISIRMNEQIAADLEKPFSFQQETCQKLKVLQKRFPRYRRNTGKKQDNLFVSQRLFVCFFVCLFWFFFRFLFFFFREHF
ncbi:transmembrane protein, putative (macronuclear) [Tetrahymena thermophila SB210]|uniref:Transmembrane protein, putative n=1 Tax=Tetrahymena thermophila (strain SB210) TaxID=312017 RepID=Q22GW7_TETTS|nr:transmembrane protein, putative [Tetrahymena thermophila SB210]EAR84557.2 transmembrane protein, putative [Tetrahymena thermophila SB210]|eukprot:XP_001032220.2 transmembrane protein, putative [Tetrahymena thermophila SB210]